MAQWLVSFAIGIMSFSVANAFWFAILILIEETLPLRGPKIRLESRLRMGVFWLIYAVLGSLIMIPVGLFLKNFKPPMLWPHLAPATAPHTMALIAGAVAAAFIGDFFYYWCHRFQHRFLWRFHAVHHSVEEMSGISAVHHFTEPLIKWTLYSVPMAFFIRDPATIPIVGTVLGVWGHYLHSPTRLHFGPAGAVLVDNRFHRIHHSVHPEHFDKNFGVVTTLWDHLFGTAHVPATDEWPQTGAPGYPEPASIVALITMPFHRRIETVAATPIGERS